MFRGDFSSSEFVLKLGLKFVLLCDKKLKQNMELKSNLNVSGWLCPQIHERNKCKSSVGGTSVQFSHSVVSNSLQPHESQRTRPPCPSPAPRVHSNSCPSSPWWHPAISSSLVPFSSCPQSLPASESFPMSQLFAWGGQNTGVSALASFLQKKSQG